VRLLRRSVYFFNIKERPSSLLEYSAAIRAAQVLQLGGQYTRLERGRTMATRTCASGNRTFEITLSGTVAGILAGTPAGSDSSWTVEHVYDKSLNCEIRVPGMDSIIVAATEDAAFARTCDHIDKWLRQLNQR
jgi:hypothetical protein